MIVLIIVASVVAVLGYAAVLVVRQTEALVRERCTAVVRGESYSMAPDQAANAALISALSVKRGLPPRAASIALATAAQESKLRNIDHGHMDSLGLFQQRPSQGWGTAAQVTDPVHATNAFYDALVTIEGYTRMPITEAAQQVQVSAYPQAYAKHEPEARAFASALTGYSPAALTCVLRSPDGAATAAQVNEKLATAFGAHESTISNRVLTVSADGHRGWAMAHWAVANARKLGITQVTHDGRRWVRGNDQWQHDDSRPDRVTITVADPQAD